MDLTYSFSGIIASLTVAHSWLLAWFVIQDGKFALLCTLESV